MGILSNLRLASGLNAKNSEPEIVTAQLAPFTFPDGPVYPYTYGTSNTFVTRQDAMSVPAVARGRQLICSLGAFGFEVYDEKTGQELPKPTWAKQMNPSTPNAITLAWLIDSLIFYPQGYLQTLAVYAEDGRPSQMAWIDPNRVSYDTNFNGTLVTQYYLDGAAIPMSGVGSLITVQGFDEGVLSRAGVTIRTAKELENTALNYALNPSPTGIVKNNGADLDPEQATGLMERFNRARKTKAHAYMSKDLDYVPISFDARAMQMTESRQYMAVEIARLMNCPAWYLAADQGTGMTYASSLDERRSLVDFTLRPYIAAIEARLSMDDITPRGQIVRFDLDDFLRGNPIERIAVWEKMIQLGLMTVDEVRAEEDLAPRGNEAI
jgi:HK97 family phage portal protein